MKKIIFILLLLLTPLYNTNAVTAVWNATSTTQGWVMPNRINGTDQTVVGRYFIATSTTASQFPYASSTALTVSGTLYLSALSNGCLQVATGAVTSTGSACSSGGSGTDVNWTFFNGSAVRPATSTNSVLIGGTATTTANSLLQVLTQAGQAGFLIGSTTTHFIVNSVGNVGIGTASPTQALTMGGDTSHILLSGAGVLYVRDTSSQIYEGGGLNVIAGSGRSLNLAGGTGTDLTITSGGNVGIGSTSPTTLLVVGGGVGSGITQTISSYPGILLTPNSTNAQISLGTTANIQAGLLIDSGGKGYVGTWTSNAFVIRTGNSDRVTIDTSGNVGIGTTTPMNKLTIIAGNQTALNISYNGDPASAARTGLFMWTKGSSYALMGGGVEQTADNVYTARSTVGSIMELGSGDVNFYGDSGLTSGSTFTPTARMTIKSSGNVGIGSTSPWGKLSVTNTGTDPSFIVEDDTTPDATPFTVSTSGAVGIGKLVSGATAERLGIVQSTETNGSNGLVIFRSTNDSQMWFGYNSATASFQTAATFGSTGAYLPLTYWTSGVERMRINTSGDVGIGTSTQAHKLSVQSTADDVMKLSNFGANSNPAILLQNDAETWNIQNAGARSDSFEIYDVGSGAVRFTITQAGNVGIGSTTPAQLLSVQGNALISGTSTVGNLLATSTVTVPTLTSALIVTDANGLLAEYAGTSCTNQFVRSLSALGAATCETVANTDLANSSVSYGGVSVSLGGSDATPAFNLADATGLPIAAGTTGTLTVARGGTGLTTFGGANHILYTTAADTLASEAAFLYDASLDKLTVVNASTTNATVATLLKIPVASSFTTTSTGEFGIDSTSGQVRYNDGVSTKNLGNGSFYPSFAYSTTTTWTGTTTIPLGPAYIGETWNGVKCFTDASFVAISFYDGTNRMNYFVASTTVGTVGLTTNNTFTAGEKRYVDIGTTTTATTLKISCTVDKSYTED